ncbi:MAG: putative quinol monooxygenase [Roseovarius sp.]
MGVIRVHGTLSCAPEEAAEIRAALAEHIRLSRAEPGCLEFEVSETAPGVFALSEAFRDRAAFEAHQRRARASAWGRRSAHLRRELSTSEE